MTSLKELYEVISMGYSESIKGRDPEKYSLLPYAKDVMYTDGMLRFTLVFFNDENEANMVMAFNLSDELESNIDDMLGI